MATCRQSLLFDKQSNIMCKEENYAWIEKKEKSRGFDEGVCKK